MQSIDEGFFHVFFFFFFYYYYYYFTTTQKCKGGKVKSVDADAGGGVIVSLVFASVCLKVAMHPAPKKRKCKNKFPMRRWRWRMRWRWKERERERRSCPTRWTAIDSRK